MILFFLTLILTWSCETNGPIIAPQDNLPNLLIGLSLQNSSNTNPGLDGFVEALDYAVEGGANIFGMSPEWDVLEPSAGTYILQEHLLNPLQLLDPDKQKLQSFVLVIKMIDTNNKIVPEDLKNVSFDGPQMLDRFSKLLDQILLSDDSVDRISHILIGNEVDGYLGSNPSQLIPFKIFFQKAVDKIHQVKPNIKVGTIITFNSAQRNSGLFNTLKTTGDFICYTYYPDDPSSNLPWQLRSPLEVKADIDWMVTNANNMPIAFTEIGYSSSGQNGSSEILQAQFIDEMFNALKPHISKDKVAFLYYHGVYDYPKDFCQQYGQEQGVETNYLCGFMNNLGLHSWQTGVPKLAWNRFVVQVTGINQ